MTLTQPGQLRAATTPKRPQQLPWLPVAWVAMFFVSSFRFTGGRDVSLAAEGIASPEIALEIFAYLLIGSAAGTAWLRWRPIRLRSPGLALLYAFGLLAVLSTAWSIVPLFTLVRGAQVLIVALLAIVTAHAWRNGHRSFANDWRWIWSGFLLVVVILGLTVFVWPFRHDDRVNWQGMHPTLAADVLAVAGVVAISQLVMPRWALGRRHRTLLPYVIGLLSLLLLLTITRGSLAAFVVASVATYLAGRSASMDRRLLTVAGIAGLALLAGLLYTSQLVEYVLRGQSVEQFATFTGRAHLWDAALDSAADAPLAGRGYGAGRVVLTELLAWAGTGHNIWVEALIGLGVTGAVLITVVLGWILLRAIKIQRYLSGPHTNLAIGLSILVIVNGVSSGRLMFPGHSLTAVGLLVAALAVGKYDAPSSVRSASRRLAGVRNR